MELPRDDRFREEAAAFSFRYECEDCGLFDALRGCAHGYPTERHRRAAASEAKLILCKDFEVI